MHISVSTVMNLQTRMRFLQNEIAATPPENMWVQDVAETWQGTTGAELVTWIESTSQIRTILPGNLDYDATWEESLTVKPRNLGNALELTQDQFRDYEAQSFRLAANWVSMTTKQSIMFPQIETARLINNGAAASSLAYDGLPFFSASHLVSRVDSSLGTYGNLITAKPIDSAVAIDVAAANLNAACNLVEQWVDASGQPAGVVPYAILYPSALADRVDAILNARFMPSGSGATIDRDGQKLSWYKRLAPIKAVELGAAFGGSDTAYYLLCKSNMAALPPGIGYLERQPFEIQWLNSRDDYTLTQLQKLEWHNRGRAQGFYGDPRRMVKCS